MTHEDAIRELFEQLADIGVERKNRITGLYFDRMWKKQVSYAKWTCYELLILLKKEKNKPSVLIVEEFIHKMDKYSTMNPKNSFIFSVAKDTAENFLDMLL